MAQGLFVGLTTLDLIYRVQELPQTNQKVVAMESAIAAGGPATNAAITFAHLGQDAQVLTALGQHPLTPLIRSDLQNWGVSIRDLTPQATDAPPVSSILVTQATGERAVVSLNATRISASPAQIPAQILAGVDIVLVDGHQLAVGVAIAQQAQAQGIPVVLDGGSWKPGLEALLPWITYAICSADFWPPGCVDRWGAIAVLQQLMPTPARIAFTQGDQPIQYLERTTWGELPVPGIAPVDTLGAGDVFHGAFCHFVLTLDFTQALGRAAEIAAWSCQSFGTRTWLESGIPRPA